MLSRMLLAALALAPTLSATAAEATVTYSLFFDDENVQVYLDDFIRSQVSFTYQGQNDRQPFGYCFTQGFATCRSVTFTPGSDNDVVTVGLSNPVNGNYSRDHVFAAGTFAQPGRRFSTIRSELAVAQFGSVSGGVPEPATWAMMMLGFGGLGYAMRRGPRAGTRIRFA